MDNTPTDGLTKVGEDMQRVFDEMRARHWSLAYDEALQLLRTMEERLSTRKPIPLKRFILVPVYLWLRGFQQMAISYGRGYVLTFAVGVASLYLVRLAPTDWRAAGEQAAAVLNLVLAFTLVFAAPSTYCSAGTNSKHVRTITDHLHYLKVESATRVDLILKNVRIFEDRVKRRLVIFRWLLGAGWALYFSPLIAESAKAWSSGRISLAELTSLFPPLAWLVVFFVLVEAYARGVDILFRSIELGCNEWQADLDDKAKAASRAPPNDDAGLAPA